MTEVIEKLLSYCRDKERVCPAPQRWNELWQILTDGRQKGLGREPSLPLILAAWWETTDQQKQDRLEQHIRWGFDHGAGDEVAQFLRSLPENEWHHVAD